MSRWLVWALSFLSGDWLVWPGSQDKGSARSRSVWLLHFRTSSFVLTSNPIPPYDWSPGLMTRTARPRLRFVLARRSLGRYIGLRDVKMVKIVDAVPGNALMLGAFGLLLRASQDHEARGRTSRGQGGFRQGVRW